MIYRSFGRIRHRVDACVPSVFHALCRLDKHVSHKLIFVSSAFVRPAFWLVCSLKVLLIEDSKIPGILPQLTACLPVTPNELRVQDGMPAIHNVPV